MSNNPIPTIMPASKYSWASVFSKLTGLLPTQAKSRILSLLVALVVIKLTMLVGLREYLFEYHFRVQRVPLNWTGYVSFYAFIIFGVTSIICLSRRSQPWAGGRHAVRVANSLILGLGLAFIFMTFCHYQMEVIKATGWQYAWHQTTTMLFSKPIFLAAWMAGYLVLYLILACTGRETSVLYLTAIVAGAYALVNLRWLAENRCELLVADGFGLAFILSGTGPGRARDFIWLLAPIAWTAFSCLIFRLVEPILLHSDSHYFIILVSDSLAFFGIATFLAIFYRFHQTWVFAIPFYLSSFWLLISAESESSLNFEKLIYLGAGLPRYFAGEFLIVAALALVTALYCWFMPKDRLWLLDIVNIILIMVALADLRLVQVMGVRLGYDVLSFENSPAMIWKMATPYLPAFLLACVLVAAFYGALVLSIKWWLCRNPQKKTSPLGTEKAYMAATCVIMCIIGMFTADPDKAEGLAVVSLIEDCPWWRESLAQPLTTDQFVGSIRELGLGNLGRTTDAGKPVRNLNVVLIFMESSYNKYLSLFDCDDNSEPCLSKYKNRMQIFPNYFSSFPSSIHARFAAFTSLYPVRDYEAFTLHRVQVKSLFEIMHDRGYFSSLFYSSSFDYTGFRDFLKGRGFDEMYDADTMPGTRKTPRVDWGLPEGETAMAICEDIKQMARTNRPFFLTYIPAAPHYPYDGIPEKFAKFQMTEAGNYKPLYINSLFYMDAIIAGILDQLKESGLLDKTLVVITDDHGEMLGDNGGPVGHGWVVNPELTMIPLIIMDPKHPSYQINYAIGSEVDLMPTILDCLGIQMPSDQIYEGRSLFAAPVKSDHLIYLNSFQQYGIIQSNLFICGSRYDDKGNPDHPERVAYEMVNETNRTHFINGKIYSANLPLIGKFDEFQENLLKNYSFYCKNIGQIQRVYAEDSGQLPGP